MNYLSLDGPAWVARGDWQFATAPDILAQAAALQANGIPARVNLSQVGRMDSAGLAVLVELARQARLAGTLLLFHNPPADLRRLAEAYGVDAILMPH